MFYCIIITNTQAIFAYPSLQAATEKFHTELAYAYNQGISCTCVVMDKHGAVYRSEEYTAPMEVATEA